MRLNRVFFRLTLLAVVAVFVTTAAAAARTAPQKVERWGIFELSLTGPSGGNYNETIHRHGKDRQFRGRLRGIQIFGSRIGPRGPLSLSTIRKHQRDD